VSLLTAVKQANQPGPPENSVVFRAATTLAVAVAIAACWAQAELPGWVAVSAIALVVVGNAFSYWRRSRAFPYLKIFLAVSVVVAFGWFFTTISKVATAGDLASVEGPLAILFAVIQVTHAFDVPSRRDLGFSLAGSATLMAVAAAQAVDGTFGLYVVVWAACGLVGLLAMWDSMAGGSRFRLRTIVLSAATVLVLGVAVVAVLPAPHANSSLVLPSALAGDLPISQAAGLVGGGARGTEPLHAASASGRTRVGGFLGFAGPLDTAIRGALGNQVVLRVRADRPSFWIAETFNDWNGQSWTEAPPPKGTKAWRELSSGPPFTLPPVDGATSLGGLDYQTFYIAQAGPNLVFHAPNAAMVWFPASRLFVGPDGTIRSGTSMGPGSVYTVLSDLDAATPTELEHARGSDPAPGAHLPPAVRAQSLQLPHPYRRAAALAARVTAHAPTTYAKVVALEHWIGAHTRYTTDIPPLSPGQDTVDQFLFGSRRGYCEQISTALAVMLRTLGIPAREATGYVPGPYNPITDLYDVQAKDAHAWVQVYFPGYGWQSFDPTAYVPLANPTPGDVIGHDVVHLLGRVPWVPLAAAIGGLALVAMVAWRRRRAPRTWAAAVSRELERAAHRAHLPSAEGETLVALALRLDRRRPPPGGGAGRDGPGEPRGARGSPVGQHGAGGLGRDTSESAVLLAHLAEGAAYGGHEPDRETKRAVLRAARRLRRRAHRRARRPVGGSAPGEAAPGGPGPGGPGPGGPGPGGPGPGGPDLEAVSPPAGAPGPLPSSPRQRAGAGMP